MRSWTIILFISLVLCNALLSQQSEQVSHIKKSTDKVKIDDKYYYVHIVKKGESLYSISKAYGVSQIDIASDNPDIYLGLQVDQAIKIIAKDLPIKDDDDKFIHHIVKKGETPYGISKRYGISIEEIYKANPEVESVLILNQVLLIPKDKSGLKDQKANKDSVSFIYHNVKPKEGLYSISKYYNVSIKEIENYNKDLLAKGLKFGSVLKIPRQTIINLTTTQQPQIKVEDKKVGVTEIKETTTKPAGIKCDTFNYSKTKPIYNIVLLLPILAEEQEPDSEDMIDPETGEKIIEKPKDKNVISSRSSNYLDFYEGFLLAVDSLKREGLSLNISVFNTKNNVDEVNNLKNERAIQNANLIIGPVNPELLSPMASFSCENRINIVSPLSPDNSLLKNNPYLFQVNPSTITQIKEFVSNVNFTPDQNIIVVSEDSSNVELVTEYKKFLENRINQASNSDAIHFKELSYKPGGVATEIKEKLNQSLTDQKENVILIPSESEAFVADFLSHLFGLKTYYGYNIKVYGFPKWQRFKNIPIVDYYYNLNLHLFTPFYVDYSHKNVRRFVDKYRRYYKSEPTQYAFQGYDIGLYFLKAMKTYGLDFKYCLNGFKVDLLQSGYKFEQESDIDGFENKSIFSIRYTMDYDILREEQ